MSNPEREREEKKFIRSAGETRQWQYRFLALRDGEKCWICGVVLKVLLVGHFPDGAPNEPEFLHLVCQSCNFKMRKVTGKVRVSARKSMAVADEGGVERESPELKIAKEAEPIYYQWLLENVERQGGLTFFDAVYEGAEFANISPVTARRYLYKKLASRKFRLGEGSRGHRRLLFGEDQ